MDVAVQGLHRLGRVELHWGTQDYGVQFCFTQHPVKVHIGFGTNRGRRRDQPLPINVAHCLNPGMGMPLHRGCQAAAPAQEAGYTNLDGVSHDPICSLH